MQLTKYRWYGELSDYFEWLPEPDSTEGGGTLSHVDPGEWSKVIMHGTLEECTSSVPEGLDMEEASFDIPEPTADSNDGVSDEGSQAH